MPKKSKNITLDIKEIEPKIDACWEGYEAIGLKKREKKWFQIVFQKKILREALFLR